MTKAWFNGVLSFFWIHPKWCLDALDTVIARGVAVMNPDYELPFTHHQRSPAHHMDSYTTQTVTLYNGLHFPSSIALIKHTQLNPIRHAL